MPKNPIKAKFDAVLKRMLGTPPVQHKELIGTPPAKIEADEDQIMFSRAMRPKGKQKGKAK